MKIAFTGDVHLRSQKDTPERYHALRYLLDYCREHRIPYLVIAGDLFDSELPVYTDFDQMLTSYPEIECLVIPGNHDATISRKLFSADNLNVFSEPVIQFMGDKAFFFVPYLQEKSMGEVLANHQSQLPEKWVLVGHGDFLERAHKKNPYEPGMYMPLTRRDIEYYRPQNVILGHIHQYYTSQDVSYTGSPMGLNIHETGKRRFLVMDLDSMEVQSEYVQTDYIFLNETILAMPDEQEPEHIRRQVREMWNRCNISPEKEQIVLRLIVKGMTSDRYQLKQILGQQLTGVKWYDSEIDLNQVRVSENPEMKHLISKISDKLDSMNMVEHFGDLTKQDVLEAAMRIMIQ